MEEILKIDSISKKYQEKNGEIEAIKNVSFSIYDSEFISIIGPSGCGKSTLLSIIAGLEEKTSGSVYIQGEKIDKVSDKIGYMLQKDSLLEWRTIYENVLFGIEIQGKKKNKNSKSNKNNDKNNQKGKINNINEEERNKQYVDELLKKYNLYEFKNKYPSQLSGGMRQRVALIRTLAIKPQILLLDEAFSALDYQTRLMVTKDIYEILRNEKITMLMVTHDISEAISMSDRVIVLDKRPTTVKSIHNIEFEMEDRNPLNCRKSPKFSEYFDCLWKELDVHG